MAPWLSVLNTVLPYLTTIVTATVPAFTAKKDNEQIAELQAAVRHNAESIKLLAEQMQRTVQAIEAGAASAERAMHRAQRLSAAALAIAVLALGIAVAAAWSR